MARLAPVTSYKAVVTNTIIFLMLIIASKNMAWAQENKDKLIMQAPVKTQKSASPKAEVTVSKSYQKLTPSNEDFVISASSQNMTGQDNQQAIIKPTKHFNRINVESAKPIKVASVQPAVKKAPKSQQVLHAPIVVLPLVSESNDVESRLHLKPKKQQVLHPPIIALADTPAKPAMVLKPKVVVEQTAIKPANTSWVQKTVTKKKSSFTYKPVASTVTAKPTRTATFSSNVVSNSSFSNKSLSSSTLSSNTLTAGSKTKKPKRKIYQYETNGITTFSNVVPHSADFDVLLYDCFACQVDSQVDWSRIPIFAFKHKLMVNNAAEQFNLDPALIRAVIHAESAFNPKARSKVGAIGLMQLMPATAKELGVKDAYNVEQNILGGSQYLAYLLDRFDNDIELACAAYNAGPTTVTKYQGIPPYPETQAYVERVKILLKRYQAALAS